MVQKQDLIAMAAKVNPHDVYSIGGSMVGIALGRLLYWAERKKRIPTWKELLIEPVIIVSMGVMSGGLASMFGVESATAYSGLGAISGYYGPKAIDLMIRAVCKKVGLDDPVCQIEVKDTDK